MSTISKGKHRLNDMSIDPSTIKKSTVTETTTEGNKVVKVKKERKDPSRYPSHHRGHGKVSNWVCVKREGEVQRVARATVEKLLAQGWNYCPRKEWKAFNKLGEGFNPNELGVVVATSKKGKSRVQ